MAGNLAKIGKVLGQVSTSSSTKVCAPAVAIQNRKCEYLRTISYPCQYLLDYLPLWEVFFAAFFQVHFGGENKNVN